MVVTLSVKAETKPAQPFKELMFEDLQVGSGAEVKSGNDISAHYTGTLASNDEKFDSSYDRDDPLKFPVKISNAKQCLNSSESRIYRNVFLILFHSNVRVNVV